MIYKIKNKYYVKIGYDYNEIQIALDDKDDVVLIPLKNRIEGTGVEAKQINFLQEKENLKKELLSKNNTNDDNYYRPEINKRSKNIWK